MLMYDVTTRPTDKEKSREWFENYCRVVDKEARTMQSMLDDNYYVNWIEEFTKKNKSFYTDQWDYDKEGIDALDLDKVRKLHSLFNVIERYANANYIIGFDNDEAAVSYCIRYNGVVYKIGVIACGAIWFCKRIDDDEIPEDKTIIEFKDIQENKEIGTTPYMREKLEKLSSVIQELKGCGVPESAIRSTVEDTLRLDKKR